jgi:hypothetical protein
LAGKHEPRARVDRFEQLEFDAEKRKAQRIVARFFDREEARALPPLLMFAAMEGAIERLLSMGDPAEVRAIVEEMLEEAAIPRCGSDSPGQRGSCL